MTDAIVSGSVVMLVGFVLLNAPRVLADRQVSIAVTPYWDDGLGKPSVPVRDDGFVAWTTGIAKVEFENYGGRDVTVADLWMDITTPRCPAFMRNSRWMWLAKRLPHRTLFSADPIWIPNPLLAMRRDATRRVNIALPAGGAVTTIGVEFSKEWAFGARDAPPDPKIFAAFIRARLTDGREPLRVEFKVA